MLDGSIMCACFSGLFLVHNNSTPLILLSQLPKNLESFPFCHNYFDLFLSLIRTKSSIFKFTFLLFKSFLFWFEYLSNKGNECSLVNRLVKGCKMIYVCFTFSHNLLPEPHLWYRNHDSYYARNDHESNSFVVKLSINWYLSK